MNKEGCKNCARLMRIVNNGTMFCTTDKGILYFVDDEWFKENNCENKVNEFTLKSN